MYASEMRNPSRDHVAVDGQQIQNHFSVSRSLLLVWYMKVIQAKEAPEKSIKTDGEPKHNLKNQQSDFWHKVKLFMKKCPQRASHLLEEKEECYPQ